MTTHLDPLPSRSLPRRRLLAALLGLAATPHLPAAEPLLGDFGPAPALVGLDAWFNSPPLTLAGLRGKVVLVDFWTFGCINCLHTLPHVNAWAEKYREHGLVVIGIHTPEYAYEHSASALQTAMRRFGVRHPVAQDNRYETWRAWRNQYWPAHYLVDQRGTVVRRHVGEGGYDEMERAISTLLAQPPAAGRPRISPTATS